MQIAGEDSYEKLLKSLYFPDIHARQEGIEEAHEATFEWIFEKPSNQVQPWHDFVHWLENGYGTYWISGKAGSGKSTLMNFICQDPRTDAALRVWSGTSEILLPNFFFWNAGTELQKSSRGLLRSIIYQILEKAPELMPVLETSINTAQQLPTWTERLLLATLQRLLCYGLESHRFYIFIDGLDEFSSHQEGLLELIRGFRQYPSIKICLSSRPHRSFRDEFGSSTMLKLQDLTEPDIRNYVSDKLDRTSWKVSQTLDTSFGLRVIEDTIVQKAEGVFLWVRLAVRDQIEGIRNGDNAIQLQERLEDLPDEIEGVYTHMLQRIDKVYWKEVAQYFHLVLNFPKTSLFNIALAGYSRIDDILLFSPGLSLIDISRHCRFTRERIATTCQGILEVRETDRHQCQKLLTRYTNTHPPENDSCKSLADQNRTLELRNDLIELKSYKKCSRVAFLHRTALDFIKENGQARKFLEASASVSPHPRILYVKALLAKLVVFLLSTDITCVRESIANVMTHAAIAEERTGLAHPALMGLLDRSLSILCQRSPGHSSTFPWCRVWDYPEVPNSSRDDGILSITATNFLGFAASFGLGLYVLCTIDSQSEPRTCSTTDYLLDCALHGPDYIYKGCPIWYSKGIPSPNISPYLKLIRALLERGANPQMKMPGNTAWGLFLDKLWKDCHHRNTLSIGRQADWGTTVRAFLASGANCNEMRNYIMGARNNDLYDPVFVGGLLVLAERIWLHLSPLTVLRLSIDRGPLLSQLEDAFIASGASVCSDSTRISVMTRDKREQGPKIDLKLSQKQWDDFMDALKRRPDVEARLAMDYITKLFREMDLQQLYDQARQEDALQDNVIQEEASGEDGVNTDIEDISDEWSTESSDSLDAPDAEIEEPSPFSQSPAQSPQNLL